MLLIMGNNIANFLNYLFHLVMARMLGPKSYGELEAVISLITLLTIIPAGIGLVATRAVSASSESHEVQLIIRWLRRHGLIIAFLGGVIIVFLAPVLANFLRVSMSLLFIVAVFFVIYFPLVINRSILQGLFRFRDIAISLIIENGTKIIASSFFVYMGFATFGATGGFVVGGLVALLFIILITKNHRLNENSKESTIDTRELYFFALPVIVSSLAMTSLYSTDVILAKHYLSSIDAGFYASLSTLGRIIFFGTTPVVMVVFPSIVKKYNQKGNYVSVLFQGGGLIALMCMVALAGYYLFPNLIVFLLYGASYLSIAPQLIWFGLFAIFLTLCNLFLNFFLAINKTWVAYLALTVSICQVLLITVFHGSILQLILCSVFTSSVLFISMLGVFIKTILS